MVRISSTTRDLRFRPPVEQVAVTALDWVRHAGKVGATVGGVGWLTAIVLGSIGFDAAGVVVLFLGGLAAGVMGGAAQLLGAVLRGPLALVQWRRLQGPHGGGSVSIGGRAVALRSVRAPSGEDVIAFRARYTRGGRGPEIERAEPFWLDDGAPDPVLVDVTHLHLADALPPALPGAYTLPVETIDLLPPSSRETERRELLLRAGDQVVVTGWLSEEVDPSMSTHFRGVPVRRVLSGTSSVPLIVRRFRPAL
jgi:hypothetical protein